MEFLNNLTILMQENNITKYKLAKEINVAESTIRSWYNGKIPSLDKVIKISHFFAVSISELVGEKHTPVLTENETELLKHFRELPDREQIKMIGRVEDAAAVYKNDTGKSSNSMIG